MSNSKARKKLDSFYTGIRMISPAIKKRKYAKKRLKLIGGGYKGTTKEFNDVVVPFWKKYGITAKKYWYDLLCARDGHYDPRYIPDDIWYRYVINYFDDFTLADALGNKGLLDRIFPTVKQPEVVVKNMATYFYNGNNKMLTLDEAVDCCMNQGKLVIKPTAVSGGGINIKILNSDNMNKSEFISLFEKYGKEFVVQRFVKQHADIARIHENSLNTIRVMTFLFKGKVHILSALLRMGAGTSEIDNISAGGVACPIKPDGWLRDKAVTRTSEWLDHHPSGIKFRDIRVPSYDKVIAKAKELHSMIPYFCIVGWDFAVDEQGVPVMIEYNTGCEQNQISDGPTFGDMTAEVLEDVFITKSLKK